MSQKRSEFHQETTQKQLSLGLAARQNTPETAHKSQKPDCPNDASIISFSTSTFDTPSRQQQQQSGFQSFISQASLCQKTSSSNHSTHYPSPQQHNHHHGLISDNASRVSRGIKRRLTEGQMCLQSRNPTSMLLQQSPPCQKMQTPFELIEIRGDSEQKFVTKLDRAPRRLIEQPASFENSDIASECKTIGDLLSKL